MSAISKPLAAMPRGNAKARSASDAAKSERVAWSVAADLLLLEAPARLDRVEVVRVRRKVDDAHAGVGAERDDALIVMCREVVEDEDVAALEPWEQLPRQPRDEAFLAGAGENGGEQDPAGQPHRAEQGEVLAPVHGRALDEFAALLHPGVAAGHRAVEPGLVEEDELARRHATD